MRDAATKAKIEAFWDWFLRAEADIRAYFSEEEEALVDKNALIESINNSVLDFGLFAWEIGPGQYRPYHFTISPNGSPERLKLSKAIVQAAPDLADWEFYPAKPVRADRLQFSLYDDFLMEREVDAGGWRCVLVNEVDETVVILLEADNIAYLDQDTQQTAGEMVVTNVLGEEAKINYVRTIEVVNELEEKYWGSSFLIGELGRRLWER